MVHINKLAVRLLREAETHLDELGISLKRLSGGASVYDFGVEVPGSWEAAELFTRITLGDQGRLKLGAWRHSGHHAAGSVGQPGGFPPVSSVELFISQPLIACLASQIAGWQLGGGQSAVIGSGPARAAAAVSHDPYMAMTPYRDDVTEEGVVLCVQDTQLPGEAIAREAAEACGVPEELVYLAAAPSASIVGTVQVSARILEQCCHKMYEHGFSVSNVRACRGSAPIAPLVLDEVKAMGRINDAILYGGEAEFWLDAADEDVEEIADHLVSLHSSPCYGKAFGQIFEEAGRNFYRIDHEVHSAALVHLHNVRTGRSVQAGEINFSVLEKSFFS